MTGISGLSIKRLYKPTYNARQLNSYFQTIKLPSKYLQSPIIKCKSVNAGTETEALELLKHLIHYQITRIPFENLELHYSTHHTSSSDPDHLFYKMVDRKSGRGGYCMENTYLLVTVLRSLGYDVIATGARLNSAIQPSRDSPNLLDPSYDSWNHMVAIVTIRKRKYLVDVGFGNNSLTFPVPLEEGFTATNGRPTIEMRLTREIVPDNTAQRLFSASVQRRWVYSVRFTTVENGPWIPAYCFGESEFESHQFETMNKYIAKNPRSWFTTHVICFKFLMNEKTEEIIGDIMLSGKQVRVRRHGKTRILAEFTCEKDRIKALEKYFRIKLSDTEKKGIEGLPTKIEQTKV